MLYVPMYRPSSSRSGSSSPPRRGPSPSDAATETRRAGFDARAPRGATVRPLAGNASRTDVEVGTSPPGTTRGLPEGLADAATTRVARPVRRVRTRTPATRGAGDRTCMMRVLRCARAVRGIWKNASWNLRDFVSRRDFVSEWAPLEDQIAPPRPFIGFRARGTHAGLPRCPSSRGVGST